MKLIIQIPCYNESATLPLTLKELPRKVKGFQKVEWLIINDGSKDNTVEVAKKCGVNHIVSFSKNKGLAEVFMAGINECLRLGADVIVNTDADNQYNAADIPKLVEPILLGKADVVIGTRPIAQISHFSLLKKILQKTGSFAVRLFSNTSVDDAPSGFRAFSRDAAMKINVFGRYTYTIETIIQAGWKNMTIVSVPISTNPDLRPSRLVKSIFSYVKKSVSTILRFYVIYRPFFFFMTAGIILLSAGILIGLRFLYFFFILDDGNGHNQSLILSAILIGMGFQTVIVAFVADLISINRKILEDLRYRVIKLENSSVLKSRSNLK